MPMKTEKVGYCDDCQLEIRGARKGWCFNGTVEVINDPKRSNPFANVGTTTESTSSLPKKEVVLCQHCFETRFAGSDVVLPDGTLKPKATRFRKVIED